MNGAESRFAFEKTGYVLGRLFRVGFYIEKD